MDQFIIDNAEKFKSLVLSFKPKASVDRLKGGTLNINPDVLVATRLRPLIDEEVEGGVPQAVFCRSGSEGVLDAHELRKSVKWGPAINSSDYQVDRSFTQEVATEEIYENLVKPLVPWAWGGGIGTLFAYGQTGSGKTFTVSCLEQLVAETLMSGELDGERKVYMTVFELAGNSAFDLLNGRRSISILEDSFGVTQLAGALEVHVQNTKDIHGLVDKATSFRRTAPTLKNDASSRSHAVCRFRIENPSMLEAEDGMLYCIDLAGSEAARDRAQHGADRMKEAREINASLSVLKDCIRGKAEADAFMGNNSKKKPHIPFRQSALTRVLKHVFDPAGMRSCKTVVIACVNPSLPDIGPSKNTLRYAEMLRVLVPKTKPPRYDPEVPMTWSNAQLRDWVDNNSGNPSVNSSILCPVESGAQLLRLPMGAFESRCLKTGGVSSEQARAFWSKLWQKHVDSQHKKMKAPTSELESLIDSFDKSSSKDPSPKAMDVPFKERIRPGMVVSWTPPPQFKIELHDGISMVLVMSTASAVTTDLSGVTKASANEAKGPGKWLCAMVLPGLAPMSYGVEIWRHIIIDESWMNKEILLEFDSATRYYYIAI